MGYRESSDSLQAMSEDAEGANRKIGFFISNSMFYIKQNTPIKEVCFVICCGGWNRTNFWRL